MKHDRLCLHSVSEVFIMNDLNRSDRMVTETFHLQCVVYTYVRQSFR